MNRRVLAPMMACAGLALLGFGLIAAAPPSGGIFPPNSQPYGQSYAQWSAKYCKWGFGLPVEGHPFSDTPSFDVTDGQSGNVWFLAGVFGTVERTCTIPTGKALFVTTLNADGSSLEEPPFFGATEAEQRAIANFFADHIVLESLFCTLDGVPVDLGAFRFESPQFTFTAPTPWIFGATGGTGTAVADGYYVFLKPLSVGLHILKYGGAVHFSIAEGDPFDADYSMDMTYNLKVVGPNVHNGH